MLASIAVIVYAFIIVPTSGMVSW